MSRLLDRGLASTSKLSIYFLSFHTFFSSLACGLKCTRNFAPVCGSDDETYPNECILRLTACRENRRILKKNDGSCTEEEEEKEKDEDDIPEVAIDRECPNDCGKDFAPVCGSNGRTYNNHCLLKQESCNKRIRITKASDGPCKGKQN